MSANPAGNDDTISPDSFPHGGATKVEIDSHQAAPPKFVGLGKEELLQYANDPFWVRMRWILFILFWVAWLGMLAGAVVIIINAPKEKDPLLLDGPMDGPYYQIYLNSYTGNGTFNEVDDEIEYLEKLGIRSVIISQVLTTDPDATKPDLSRVIDFKNVDRRHGDLTDFENLIKRLKDKAINVILQFIPNHSSIQHPWFKDSENRTNRYVLKNRTTDSTWESQLPGAPLPAWSSVPGDADTNYLHQFQGQEADLDYQSEDVIAEINDALGFWFKEGVTGFLLSDVSFLLEDMDSLNDTDATINQLGNFDVIQRLINSSKWTLPENSGTPYALLDLNEVTTNQSAAFYTTSINPVSTILAELPSNFSGIDLQTVLLDAFKGTPENSPIHWRLSSPRHERPESKFGREKADALALVTFLLRGQVILYYGDEYGISPVPKPGTLDVSTEQFVLAEAANTAKFEYYQKLVEAHNNLGQRESGGGSTEYSTDQTYPEIFVMKRSAGMDILVAVNFGEVEQTTNIGELLGDSTGVIILVTANLNTDSNFVVDSDFSESTFTLPAHSGIVLELTAASD